MKPASRGLFLAYFPVRGIVEGEEAADALTTMGVLSTTSRPPDWRWRV